MKTGFLLSNYITMFRSTYVTLARPAARPATALLCPYEALQIFQAQCRVALTTLSSVSKKEDSRASRPKPCYEPQFWVPARSFRCDAGRTKESGDGLNGTKQQRILQDTQYDPFVIGSRPDEPPVGENTMMHPVYTEEEVNSVKIIHVPPKGIVEHLAFVAVQTLRWSFDFFSGYTRGTLTESKMLTRIIFLETTAGVPGMVGGMVRHLNSLRRMQRDHGWIHTLLSEAENERMHLMTALHLKQPGWLFRAAVLVAQGIFTNAFFIAYLVSPRFCHRLVGYLEEEAVKTYTSCLEHIDDGSLNLWKSKHAPKAAVRYWRLNDDATMRDMILAIRADEAHHRQVNHVLASIRPTDHNPFILETPVKNSIEVTKAVVRQIEEHNEKDPTVAAMSSTQAGKNSGVKEPL